MTDNPTPLAPPSATAMAALTLEAPAEVAPVTQEKIGGYVSLAPEALPELDARAAAFVDKVVALDPHGADFAKAAADIRSLGNKEAREAVTVSGRLLQRPMQAMSKDGDASAKVASTLSALRGVVEELDPKQAMGVRKILGLVPFGDKLKAYFRKFQSAQTQLDAIVEALRNGQDELNKDNVALEIEKAKLWAAMQKIAQYVHIAQQIDAALAAKITELDATDPDRAKSLREDVLFYVRQKHQDLLTQLTVAIQGYLVIDTIKKSNLELIKGVERTETTTMMGLSIAVVAANALTNQKLVLKAIDETNRTTEKLIVSTSEMLASQTGKIYEQAAATTISVDSLAAAWGNIRSTLDSIDTFKTTALGVMAQNVAALETQIEETKPYIERIRNTDDSTITGDLDLGA